MSSIGMMVGAGLWSLFALSSSTHYTLNNYSIGPGATNNSNSTTYHAQGSVGEQAIGKASGSTKTSQNGSVNAQQLSVPQAPTLSNGSGSYYNKLQVILSNNAGTNSYPTDVTFAIEVALNSSFTSPNFVQASGTLGASAVYQTYTLWGGASGSFISGLSPSTTYFVRVAAKQGLFTNTAYGASASAATVASSMTFSVSPSSISMGSIVPGASPTVSSNLTFSFATNGASGGSVYISGLNNGLKSTLQSHTVPAFTGNLASQAEGFGAQATNASQTSGGPLSISSPFNGTGNTVGAESASEQQILTTTAAIVGGSANANLQTKSAVSTPPSTDYSESLTFVGAGNF